MREFVESMVKLLVDDPDLVRVEAENDGEAITYKVHVAKGDIGKTIGKGGRLANAMRVIVKASARRDGGRAFLEVIGAPVDMKDPDRKPA